MASEDRPYSVEHSPRHRIEDAVFQSLVKGDKVAILAAKEDLEVFILLLQGKKVPDRLRKVKNDLLEGALILMDKVFK